ncbi:Mobile element protein [Bathymodiolus heckerae thiotrophic gill symbiont]|uniref:IS3 family transposase n=1 Tax=Bathymodiolus heckerae thiotrophic gill symbiont TaxID=1052212 RepID=UPI0010B4A33B|nr:IS3 family transposase [Bathymodiolus heckerae thiotrophic gill symbiont]SHN92735.1 Mobile element protein [Bathymodiolus heckerae thiotrophic gill symbiont]
MKSRLTTYPVRLMCRVLNVNRSGFYRWLEKPKSNREKENERLAGLIKQSWLESGCVYGSPRIHADLRELGERCGLNRVARIMKLNKVKALLGYKRHYTKSGKPSVVVNNNPKLIHSIN